jgi:hypothetical protein
MQTTIIGRINNAGALSKCTTSKEHEIAHFEIKTAHPVKPE